MGRPSKRAQRRAEIVGAFGRVLARHGLGGATVAAVAAEAGIAAGLVHHHFADKQDLLEALLHELTAGFRQRVRARAGESDALAGYIDAALRLDDRADLMAAKCWVGLFAEALRTPALFRQIRRLLDVEISTIVRASGHRLGEGDAGAILAFVVGALVLGAFAPRKTAGFAAPALHRFARLLTAGA